MALKKDGSVVAWGNNSINNVPTNAMSGVISISAGYNYAVALKTDGSVVAWGDVPANLPTNSIQATAVEAGDGSLLIGRQNVAGRALDDCQTSGGLQNNPFINNGGNNGARILPPPRVSPNPRATPPSRVMPNAVVPPPGRVAPPPR
jgi:alpha-tubulin suppressor-like RCC1 family protein